MPCSRSEIAPPEPRSKESRLEEGSAACVDDALNDPPDGGFRAWTQVFAGHLINMMAWGYPGSFGVYQLYYTQTLNLPSAQVSWIGSVMIFLDFGICTLSGRLADAGYSRHAVLLGTFLTVFGTFMTSLCAEYWQIFLAQGVCTGLGLGFMFMPAATIINSYFLKKRAFALAVAATGTGTGGIIFPAIIQYLIPKIGFPWAVRCCGLAVFIISCLANLLLRPRLAPRRAGPVVEWNAFREAPYVLFSAGVFLLFWALYFGFFYINAFSRNIIGFDSTSSVELMLITNALGIPARPLVGWLADRHAGPINTFIAAVVILGVMMFSWAGVAGRTGMYVFAVFYGFFSGATQGVFVSALASLTKDPTKMGTRFGMVASLCAFATVAGPPTAGAIIDRTGGKYVGAQVWAGTVIVLAAFTLGMARWWITGFRLGVKL